ncbi:MAG TPA: PAS domain-containing protein, partial [Polyangiales bacterium]|nr:PAS domain-containing protein [Polyangiales bacterium]
MAVLGEGENDVYVSPHIEQMLGYSQEEWLSDPFLWYHRLHPEDRPRWNQEFARGVRTGGPFRSECRFLARDGREVWVHGEARLVKDERGRPQFLQGVAFDISESKRAQEVLLQAAVHDARAAEEVAIAHRVQTSILPRNPALPGLEIAA